MQKTTFFTASLLFAATLAVGPARAQQSQAPASQQPAAQQQPAATPQKPATTPAKPATPKTGQTSTAKKPAPAPLTLTTPKDKLSYAIGLSIGKTLKQRDLADTDAVDPTIIGRAIRDVLTDKKQLLTDQEAQTALTTFQTEARKKQELLQQQLAEKNQKEGDAFLAENKTKEGVVTLASGLQYKVLEEGTGPKPAATDTVVVNYRGTLLNGTEFDSSYKRGQPATFGVNQVIRGWTEALQLMPVGSKWQIFIPSALAYGPRGPSPIGPNSALVFEVELVAIQPKTPPAPAPGAAPPAAPGNPPPGSAPNPTPAAAPAPTPKPAPAPPTPKPTPTPTPKL